MASAALIARKIMVLDYVLSQPEVAWLSTEDEKVDLFAARYGVPMRDLPQHVFAPSSTDASSATRYFSTSSPPRSWAIRPSRPSSASSPIQRGARSSSSSRIMGGCSPGSPPGPCSRSGRGRVRLAYTRAKRPSSAIAGGRPRPSRPRTTTSPGSSGPETRSTRGDLTSLSVAAIDRFRTLREAFRRPIFDELYLEWRRDGDAALANHAGLHQPSIRSVGALVTELLPFDHSQFGSLPGVA